MKSHLNGAVQVLVAAVALTAAAGASAQSAGQFAAKVGYNQITPKVASGDVSAPALPGTKARVGKDAQPILALAYALTDNIVAELDAGLPYTHELYGAGSIEGAGKLGTVDALPPTVFLQYRMFKPESMVRPYAGVGLTYASFQKETGSGQLTALTNPGGPPTTFEIDGKVCATLQLGAIVNIGAKYFLDFAVTKTYLKTTVHYSTGQTQKMTLNPEGVSLSVGYKF
ncbi:MAG: OmpW family outer membrane protein [Pseudomonadota bacterium]